MKTLQLIIIIALLALVAGIGMRMYSQWQIEKQPQLLPTFTFPDLNSTPQSIEQWKGKILVVNFWATWCPSCLKEIPAFIHLQSKYGEQVQFIGIALDDVEAVRAFQQKTAVNYPLLISGDFAGFQLAKKLGNFINAIPYTVVTNHEGVVIYRHSGEMTAKELEVVLNLN